MISIKKGELVTMTLVTRRTLARSSGSLEQSLALILATITFAWTVTLLSLVLVTDALSAQTSPPGTTAPATPGTMVGVAVEDITPPWPTYEESFDVLVNDHYRKLEVKALTISDRSAPVVIVTADICDFCSEISEQVYDRVKSLGFEPQQVVLNSSHIHSAPAACDVDVLDVKEHPIAKYQALLVEKIVSVVKRAKEDMRPAVLSTSEATSDICVNRDGPPHPAAGNIIPNPDGRIDRRVRLLQVRETNTGVLRAAMALFGCHPSDVGAGSYGGDYLGFGRDEVEKHYPAVAILTAQGTGGDVRVAHYKNDDIRQGFGGTEMTDLAPTKEIGRRFGAAIVQALGNKSTPVRGRVRAGKSAVALPLEKPEPRDYFAQVVATGQGSYPSMSSTGGVNSNLWYVRFAKWMLAKYDEGNPMLDRVGPYAMRVIGIGDDLTIVALDGEVQTCIGQQIEAQLAPRPTFVLGYSNNVSAYIMCTENFFQGQGGYEINVYPWWLWQTARFKPNVDTVIVGEATTLARRVLQQ
jgi:hypothetical protein